MNLGSLGSALPAACRDENPASQGCFRFSQRTFDARPSTASRPCKFPRKRAGGADRVRTDDLRLARAALSQLSYSPSSVGRTVSQSTGTPKLVGLGRFELPTSRLSGVRSNQLSYRPRPGTAPIPWKPNRERRSADRPGCEHPFTRKGFRTRSLLERR
jgi:hypothetical protein